MLKRQKGEDMQREATSGKHSSYVLYNIQDNWDHLVHFSFSPLMCVSLSNLPLGPQFLSCMICCDNNSRKSN